MGTIFIGFTFGWLSMRHNLVRYKQVALMRALLTLGHLVLAIWGGVKGGDNTFENRSNHVYSLDYVLMNVFLAAINLWHLKIITETDKSIRLHPTLDQLWKNMFG